MTDFTPETPVLTPIHDHAAELAKAEAGVAEMAANRNNRWYPKYHIASNGGWINDPNGLCFYKGRWHVFYQLHPYGTQWGPMHWGHVSSTDMLSWKREPIMFAPSLEQEKDGVFSGSAVIDDNGDLRFYYTGHRWTNGHDNTGGDWQVQMTALPDNDELTSATKQGMIIDCPTDNRIRLSSAIVAYGTVLYLHGQQHGHKRPQCHRERKRFGKVLKKSSRR